MEVDKPENAPEHCPGTSSEQAGKAAACAGCPNQAACASAPKGPDPDLAAIAARFARIRHKVLVLSGKGGVGKSTLAAQLAFALAARGAEVGLLDIDICGPSAPKMLGLEGHDVHQSAAGWSPVYVTEHLGVMSIGFMLPNPDDAVIWRGPRKNALIKQFLRDVDWGRLDYLVVDAPPGTSDEHISIAQLLRAGAPDDAAAAAAAAAARNGAGGSAAGVSRNAGGGFDTAVIVTTPQEVSIIDVRKEISFCRKVGLSVLGVVENMAGLAAPVVGAAGNADDGSGGGGGLRFVLRPPPGGGGTAAAEEDVTAAVRAALEAALPPGALSCLEARADVFAPSAGGAAAMCAALKLELLGRVPLDPQLGRAAEEGRSVFEASLEAEAAAAAAGAPPPPSIAALQAIVERVVAATQGEAGFGDEDVNAANGGGKV